MWFFTKILNPTPKLDKYNGWIKSQDLTDSESYAGGINDQKNTIVQLSSQLYSAQEKLRNLRIASAPQAEIDVQVKDVDDRTKKLRNEDAVLREMRAFARFNWPKQFTQ